MEPWNSVGGKVEQWNSDSGTVGWNNGTVMVEQCGGTVWWNSETVLVKKCGGTGEQCW